MQEYVSEIGKMALALTSAQMAKDEAVMEHGVGEELAVHFLGWSGESLGLICQMDNFLSKKEPEERFDACFKLCKILRHYWAINAITMVSEGYCSLDRLATQGQNLADAFTDPTKPVVECLTVIHSEIDESGDVGPASMVAAPYKVGVGKNVMWNDILVYPSTADSYVKNAKYPEMLRKTLTMAPASDVTAAHLVQAREGVIEAGFLMQEFFEV